VLDGARLLPTLDAGRLRLRQLTSGDLPALFEVFGDPEVCRYWSRPALAARADAQLLLAEIEAGFTSRTLFQWGVADRTTDAVVGTCTLTSFSHEHRRAEVGFALGRRHWGRGLMGEALGRLVEFAFETLDLRRLEGDADPRNQRSIRVLERAGFRREGLLRARYVVDGEVQDAVVYGLLRTEWSARSHAENLAQATRDDLGVASLHLPDAD
jgi:RimJ/RimL family protein N-acetyltransferase